MTEPLAEVEAARPSPTVSVVMPVHNALPFLDEAVESILGQSFADFEFVILDDASTDGSTERLRDWARKDRRIRLIESPRNLGPVESSQAVAESATGRFIARMDADDVSRPERLSRQLDLLLKRSEVGLVASVCDVIDKDGRRVRSADLWRLTRKSPMAPFPHSAIMYRQEVFMASGGYRRGYELWEDQDLISRIAQISDVLIIPQVLCSVRQTDVSTRSTTDLGRQQRALDWMYRQLGTDGDGSMPILSSDKVDPRVFISIGSVILWGGHRPRLFSRLIRDGKLSPTLQSAGAIAWTAWAATSPRTLKGFLRLLGGARNIAARSRLDLSQPILWSRSKSARIAAGQDEVGRPVSAGSESGATADPPASSPSAERPESSTRTVDPGKA